MSGHGEHHGGQGEHHVLDEEELKHLSPRDRIKYLEWLEEHQKKELEEHQKRAKEKIEHVEMLIEEIKEEEHEEEAHEEQQEEHKHKEESLEKRLGEERLRLEEGLHTSNYKTGAEYNVPGLENQVRQYDSRLPGDNERMRELYSRSEQTAYMPNEERPSHVMEEGYMSAARGTSIDILKGMYRH